MFFKKKQEPAALKVSEIPNIEPEAVYALEAMGYKELDDLLGENAEDIFYKYSLNANTPTDKIVLYQLRSAVYFANVKKADPKKLFWWYWKDEGIENTAKDEEYKQKLRDAGFNI